MVSKAAKEPTFLDGTADQDPMAPPVDDLVREYKAFAGKSVENVLGLASTVMRADELDRRSERERFYKEVKLDPKGSTARKLRVIGDKLPRFQPFLSIIPNTWTTLYELAKLGDEDFRTVIESGVLQPFVTLQEIVEVLGRTSDKPSQDIKISVDLGKITTPKRKAEFVQKLEQRLAEFDIAWEPLAKSREGELKSLLDEALEIGRAA